MQIIALITASCLVVVGYAEVITYHHAWQKQNGDFHYDMHVLRETGVPLGDPGVPLDSKATDVVISFISREIKEAVQGIAEQAEGGNNEEEEKATTHHTGHSNPTGTEPADTGDEAKEVKPEEAKAPEEAKVHEHHQPEEHHPKQITSSKEGDGIKEEEKEPQPHPEGHHKRVKRQVVREEPKENEASQPNVEEPNGETKQLTDPKEEGKEKVVNTMNKQAADAFVDLNVKRKDDAGSEHVSNSKHTQYHLVIITVKDILHAVGHEKRKSAHEIITANHEIASKHWQHWFRAATKQMIDVMADNPQSRLDFGGAYKEHEDKLVYLFVFKLTGLQNKATPTEQQ
ncbi:hypothetical protein DdX_18182 [Ditylenchus destructor]|uniref:Uncharacterized protein n=1 Tax=Ditylenchus destructor TaxID=166010 RepID=A0AAD4MMS2_9BILA|nr:hypothetical protein DdX_18182 [Ditylenchus destructor]